MKHLLFTDSSKTEKRRFSQNDAGLLGLNGGVIIG
jgi:hypothetical protein